MLNLGKAKFIGKQKFIIMIKSALSNHKFTVYFNCGYFWDVLDVHVELNKLALQGEKFSVVAQVITTHPAVVLLNLELKWSLL